MIVFAVVDELLSPDFPLGADLEILRNEERELEAGGVNRPLASPL